MSVAIHEVRLTNGDTVRVVEHTTPECKHYTVGRYVHGMAPVGTVVLSEEGIEALRKILFQEVMP